ncbi:FAD-dependent oxidoreductase [Streptomyces sp. NPDC048279]|uniref:FAD-dependent oxidoreductase n=1 Tax=Streptomyces sp. NPDC048279 TaxID=3154714 RepID=UPI003429F761
MRTPDENIVWLSVRHAVVVCTGTTTARPGIPGLADDARGPKREAIGADRVPGRLAVAGSGVVAVELTTAWQALGSRVTLLVRGTALLTRMDPSPVNRPWSARDSE